MSSARMIAAALSGLFLVATVAESTAPTTCNGQAETCPKPLNEVVFAGTHNSGAGYRGVLYYWGTKWGGTAASSGLYRNQTLSFTEQLEGGIRYFDIDTAWNGGHPRTSSDWWKPTGAWISHKKAYAGPVQHLIDQVDAFLSGNPNEVVVIDFNNNIHAEDQAEKGNIADDILRMVQAKWPNNTIVRSSQNSWPTLSQSIQDGRRVAILMHASLAAHASNRTALEAMITPVHYDTDDPSWYGDGLLRNVYCGHSDSGVRCAVSSSCEQIKRLANNMCDSSTELVRLSLIASYGLHISHMAGLCDDHYAKAAANCASKRKATVANAVPNFVMIDRFDPDDSDGGRNDLIRIVRVLNQGGDPAGTDCRDSVSASGKSDALFAGVRKRRAERHATSNWENKVEASLGAGFADLDEAAGKSVSCTSDRPTRCTVSARPCVR